MYLTINLDNRYWLVSNTKASTYVSVSIKEQFEIYSCYWFNNPSELYKIENNYIIRKYGNSIDSTILLELPDDCTYEQFVQNYPEMML